MAPRSPRRTSAAVEPGAELEPAPPRTWRRVASHALDRALALRKAFDATEAHAHLRAAVQSQKAGAHQPITTAPTTRLRLDEVTSNSSLGHHEPSI
jgi:hypothetical protein